MTTEIAELKRLIEILPDLETSAMKAEYAYLKELQSNSGKQENGFVYNVRPTIWGNYLNSGKYYSDANDRRWELIQKLGLSCSVKGIPDFGESKIKPYGWDRGEIRDLNDNRPIGLM
jgi:hypothetical protein